MKPSIPRRKQSFQLSESTLQKLNLYALTAGAAGVILLALVPPAEAEIVYTPAHIQISNHPPSVFSIDLNHDGAVDFSFGAQFGGILRGLYTFASVRPLHSTGLALNGVEAKSAFRRVFALKSGAVIGSSKNFISCAYGARGQATATQCDSFGLRMADVEGPHKVVGYWANVTNRYLGLKLYVNGQSHFGWARMSVHITGDIIQADLTGYAYETTPNQPIVAGRTSGTFGDGPLSDDGDSLVRSSEPVNAPRLSASLGLLALGAPGIPFWRREDLEARPHFAGENANPKAGPQ